MLWPLGSRRRLASPRVCTSEAGLEPRAFGLSPLVRTLGAWSLRESPRCPPPTPPFRSLPSALLSAAMNGGVCLCVLLAVLAAGALAQPIPAADPAGPGAQREEEAPRRQLRAVQKVDGEPRAHLGALLARYIQQARKGTDAHSSAGSLPSLLTPRGPPNPDPFSWRLAGGDG